jgi:sarcosine oxidase
VLGLEQFALGHHRGASHDHARIIRRSYHTPGYVRLAGLAYAAWAELEWRGGRAAGGHHRRPRPVPGRLGHPARPLPASLEACGVPYQWLDAAEVMRRWPAFKLDAGVHGLWQADAGIVPAARGTRLLQRLAAGGGATLLDQVPVTAVRDLGTSVEVVTADATFRAARLLLCADAWTGDLVAQLGADLPLVVTQEQFSYFRPADPGAFAVGRFPVWIWMDDPSFYGFPVWPGAALKAAQDVGGFQVTATSRSFDPDPAAADAWPGSCAPGSPPPSAPTTTARPASTPSPRTATSSSARPRPRPRPGRPRRRPRVQVRPPARPGPGRPGPATTAPTSTSARSPPSGRPHTIPGWRPATWSEPGPPATRPGAGTDQGPAAYRSGKSGRSEEAGG